jgi:hypothetical protein
VKDRNSLKDIAVNYKIILEWTVKKNREDVTG